MATTTKILVTADEFMDRYAGEAAYELVKGEVVPVSPGVPGHGVVCANIMISLGNFGRQSAFGYVLGNDTAIQTEREPDTVRGADVCFYSHARLPRGEIGMKLASVAPDLAVEVYSPSNRPGEMRQKVNEYLNAGVKLVWVVHPERKTVAMYRADDPIPQVVGADGVIENLPELPGFRCPVAEFFV